jgi:heme/copper-type cytochrome/quinol oxidase subunit 1
VADRNIRTVVSWIGAGVVVAAGAVTILVGLLTPVGVGSFGWFAYQPLADATFVPGGSTVVLSRITVVGWVIFGVGLLALAFLAGRAAGRRQAPAS